MNRIAIALNRFQPLESAPQSSVPESKQVPARRTQAQRTAETRQALIHAAVKIIYELGYGGATTAAIADEAGVSRGSITHQFGTRAALMAEVLSWVYKQEARAYRKSLRELAAMPDPAEWVRMCWAVISKPSGLAVIEILQAARRDPVLAEQILPMQRAIESDALAAVDGLDEANMTRRLDVMRMIVWSIRGLSLAKVIINDENEIERVVDLLRLTVTAATEAKLIGHR
ncbi:TetR/AcrR family transcriptional regulator [Halopseudomonas salegens]|uniref:Transcriptional regulator, TetR family n=1 Tax=Halopseudomonas salegens TaxID=1434072 RepID=A0A1H2E509_9GAMM|nr:TetR/AcrR family transcriptional regulator [Halopseudomonas salegens]SDT90201.1 transcriptional regulator, TetR family [Halopseudomonas salegens]